MNEDENTKHKQQLALKKLEAVKSPRQLQKILKLSQDQNKKLVSDIRQLKDRVELIMGTRKSSIQQMKIEPSNQGQAKVCKEITLSKKELKAKYTKMKQLKQQIREAQASTVNQTEHNKAYNRNLLTDTQLNITQLKQERDDLLAVRQKLHKTMQSTKKEQNLHQPKIEQLEQQNRALRLKIGEIRKIGHKQQHESIKVQTTLIGNMRKVRHIEARKSMMQLKEAQIVDKKQIILKSQHLKNQVENLKKEVQLVGENSKNEEAEQKKKRDQLYGVNRQIIKKMRDAQLYKCKLEQQANMWKNKWGKICRSIESLNKKIKKISTGSQTTEYVDSKPLRRDFAGVLSKYRFDDRLLLQDQKDTKLTGIMIYEIQRGIVSVQALYSNGKKTQMIIPQHFIERCRVTKIQCSQNDFFKLFKVKYNSIDNKITKLEIRSNKNLKYQYGEKKSWTDLIEGDAVYGFDIGIKEYPVCIFGSYNYCKGYWLLEGFGVEINELQD